MLGHEQYDWCESNRTEQSCLMWKAVSVSLWGNFFLTMDSRNIQSERLNSINKSFELTHCAIINKAKQNLLTGGFFSPMTSAPHFLIWVPANLQPFVKQKGGTLLYPFLSVLVYQNKQPLLIHPRNLERWIVVMMNATNLHYANKGIIFFWYPRMQSLQKLVAHNPHWLPSDFKAI